MSELQTLQNVMTVVTIIIVCLEHFDEPYKEILRTGRTEIASIIKSAKILRSNWGSRKNLPSIECQ